MIKERGKYMRRQAKIISVEEDISLMGLNAISNAHKVSVSSYRTLRLCNHSLSRGEKAPEGQKQAA